MMLRSLTAVAVAYMLVGTAAKVFQIGWSQATGSPPTSAVWLAWIALISVAGGWSAGFIAGFAPLRHAGGLAGIAITLGLVTVLLTGGPGGARLSLLGCLAAGMMVGGLLRRWQTCRAAGRS